MGPGVIAGIVVGSIIGVILVVLAVFWVCRRKRSPTPSPKNPTPSPRIPTPSPVIPPPSPVIPPPSPIIPPPSPVIPTPNGIIPITSPRKRSSEHVGTQGGSAIITQKIESSQPEPGTGTDQATKDALILSRLSERFTGPLDEAHRPVLYSDLQAGDIRVLEIMERKDNARIVCRLWEHTIEPQPGAKVNRRWSGYEALSYVWAQQPRDPNEKGKKAIITVVNPKNPGVEVDFVIGWNLNEALKFFRKDSGSRIIWTDLICINQDTSKENPERMSQVLKMTDIYKHATQVQVWLGPSTPESKRAAEYFGLWADNELNDLQDELLMNLYRSAQSYWEDLFEGFQNRPWWTRAWIIQEVVSCPDPMLNSGPDCLSLNFVLKILKFSLDKNLNLIGPKSKVNAASRLPALEILSMRNRMKEVEAPHLSEWFATFHNQCATNPKDRIFAYLGLARHALPFQPRTTYNNHSIEQVWAEGTMLALHDYNNLDFICLGRGADWGLPGDDYIPANPEERATEEELKHPLNLPSWVPNFRVSEGNGETSAHTLPLSYFPRARSAYNASGGVRSVMSANEALTELKVLGLFVDRIKRISEPNLHVVSEARGEQFLTEVYEIMAETSGQCFEFCSQNSCTHYPGPLGGSYPMAVFKALMMDLNFHGKRLKPEYGFHTLHMRFNQPPADFHPEKTNKELRNTLWNIDLLHSKALWTHWRRFFVTERGYVGIAASESRVGDSIYVLGGATIPFVMREKHSTSSEGRKKLTFVGERYLDTL